MLGCRYDCWVVSCGELSLVELGATAFDERLGDAVLSRYWQSVR